MLDISWGVRSRVVTKKKKMDFSLTQLAFWLNNLKGILWKHSIQSLKIADSVSLSLFMKDNGNCDIPHAA